MAQIPASSSSGPPKWGPQTLDSGYLDLQIGPLVGTYPRDPNPAISDGSRPTSHSGRVPYMLPWWPFAVSTVGTHPGILGIMVWDRSGPPKMGHFRGPGT